jgi:pyruvate formate lyase activating enzyme
MSNLVTNIQGYSVHDGPGIRTVVFLKGCGLGCRWCSNPECISANPEVGFVKALCTKCGKCERICPNEALVFEKDKFPQIDRERCNGCGSCVLACPYKALVLYGKEMNADEIYSAVSGDKMFYDSSGGGVTFSGGEALLQPRLVGAVFEKCHHAGISTCVETSGYAPVLNLEQVLAHTDYLLFDLKCMNSDKHLEYTGQPNDIILKNAGMAAESRIETLFRMPLVPGVNDDLQNIKDTADFLHGLGKDFFRIELMPYHRLGKGKYASLDKTYHLPDIVSPEPTQLESVIKVFGENGIKCIVSR